MNLAVETKELTKNYGPQPSVCGVDLKIPQNSIYGFLGPNGAGKSTTMKMILGLIKPTRGEVSVLGRPVNEKNRLEILKQTGSLIESPSYYGHLTGQENLEIVCTLKGLPLSEIDRVLRIVRLENQKHKKVSQYSLGMKQRLGLAAALTGTPRLILLDEPTNGLDPAGIQEIRELICALPEQYGMTVMVSSHLLAEIDQMATHVGIIDGGELIFQDCLSVLHSHSSRRLRLRTTDDRSAVTAMEEGGVSVQYSPDGLLLPYLADEQLVPLISRLVYNGVGLLRLEEQEKNLEEIFLDLTGRRMSL